ncbi:hypothetical protein KUTeg_016172 [Tegillarca granosa]|uniref:Uncharacterized protein n=1 Tax=Tegillarca granosa TaxID=220873 RepID=A0ABQ9ENW5_TEGGR|nr:hypothetical protein KUTeg_016172 [Tegillarca granosa]
MEEQGYVGGNQLPDTLNRDDLIALYFHVGYSVREILGFLVTRHGIAISERHIHRLLRRMHLVRRNNES